jgi:hypothetical protein
VHLTTFKSWNDIVEWAEPLYAIDEKDFKNIRIPVDLSGTREENVIKIIQWVQDEIRYLGFSQGMGAFKPHKPDWVIKNRYGDCKDKSILLIALLRKAGFRAYPMYVNTYLHHTIENYLPAHDIFNHCVVCLKYYGRNIFIDPTIAHQGGDLQTISFPDYKYGLIINKGELGLSNIPDGRLPQLHIEETFILDSIGGQAHMKVISSYRNSLADEQRNLFSANAMQNIQQQFRDYYSTIYPNIEISEKIIVNDELRNTSNIFTIEENYIINNAWQKLDESNTWYFEFYPLITENQLEYPQTSNRTMPYYLGMPRVFTESAKLIMPKEWPIEETSLEVTGSDFSYTEAAKAQNNIVNIDFNYRVNASHIEAKSVNEFLKKHQEIQNALGYYLSYNPDAEGFKLSWVAVLLVLIILAGSIILAFFLNRKYDPSPPEPDTNRPIGGWLILPLLGVIISPVMLIYYFIDSDFFNHNSWLGTFESTDSASNVLTFYYLGQLLIQIGFIVFSVLVLIQFLKRRSSLPFLYILMLVISSLTAFAEYLSYDQLSEYLVFDSSRAEMGKYAGRAFLGLVIWVPYFAISKRVKSTFTRRYKKEKLPEENRQFMSPVETI